MIRHLLEGNKLIFLFLTLFSCIEKKTEKITEYFYPSIVISEQLKKEIFSYKDDLKRMQATQSNNLCVFFTKKNDSIFIEIGDYEPNLKMINVKGVEIIKNDTVYLYSDKSFIELNYFYKNKNGKIIKILRNSKPNFDRHDPHFRCLYFDGKNIKINSYNNQCI
ncbi:hypothetical protein [Chryseobacterium gleum]|uniref:hypothetical protein n=1 Tax=Chryseobacterium gleum TaxID=250 RepID=UPI001E48E3AA|nr:hypothetical protein [Chryseobacterium gleum]MCD9618028.1 hypothetical protein [Chryseobacterium gleum]